MKVLLSRFALFCSERKALLAIFLAALALRLWGLGFGLPQPHARPDEATVSFLALGVVFKGFSPLSLIYPYCFIYPLSACYAVYVGLGRLFGHFPAASSALAEFILDPSAFYLMSRGFAALLGALTVIPVCLAAERLWGRLAGLLAAGFAAVFFLHVRDSHFGVLDVAMTLFIASSACSLLMAAEEKRVSLFAWGGIFAGLAAGTKYGGAPLALTALLAAFLPQGGIFPSFRSGVRSFAWFCAWGAAAFLLFNPYVILAPGKFLEAYRYLTGLHVSGQSGTLWHQFSFSLAYGCGWPMLVLSLAGCAFTLWRRPRQGLVFFSFALAYALVLTRISSHFVRYAVPLVPFVCVGAAVACYEVGVLFRRPAAAVVLALLCAAQPLAASVRFDMLASMTDTRVMAADWLSVNVPAGASVGALANPFSAVYFPVDAKRLAYEAVLARKEGNHLKAECFDAILSDSHAAGYAKLRYSAEKTAFTDLEGNVARPEWIVQSVEPFGEKFSRNPAADLSGYKLLVSFDPAVDSTAVFDVHDSFFIPYSGFGGWKRPGPKVNIYRLEDDARR